MEHDEDVTSISVEVPSGVAKMAREQAERRGVDLGEYLSGLVVEGVSCGEGQRFTVVFDEAKARRNGYDPDVLYEYVGRNVEPMGNVRVGRGTWQVREGADEFRAQAVALSDLVRMRWVMENVESITSYGEDGTSEDYLQVIRDVSPELLAPMRGQGRRESRQNPSGT